MTVQVMLNMMTVAFVMVQAIYCVMMDLLWFVMHLIVQMMNAQLMSMIVMMSVMVMQ